MTPTQTPTLAEFLLAKIAKDEEVARAAQAEDPDGFNTFPASRVLAECEAKRRIVELHTGWHLCPDGREVDATVGDDADEAWRMCPTLRLLALPYADHEQFREEWRV